MVERSIQCKECSNLNYCEADPLQSRCEYYGNGKVDPNERHIICYGAQRGPHKIMGQSGAREMTLEEKQAKVAEEHEQMQNADEVKKRQKRLAKARKSKSGYFWDEDQEKFFDTAGNEVDEHGVLVVQSPPPSSPPKNKAVKKKGKKKKAKKKARKSTRKKAKKTASKKKARKKSARRKAA